MADEDKKPVVDNQVDPEELQKKIEALDNPDTEDTKDVEETETKDESEAEAETGEEEAEAKSEETPKSDKDDTDWKARYAGSTREAQVLAAKNRAVNESYEAAAKMEPLSDAEMTKLYPDWEVMDEFNKKIARDNELSSRRFTFLSQTVQDSQKVDKWVDTVNQFSGDVVNTTKYPQLEGREVEFAQFCMVPSRVDRDLDDLAKAFVHDIKPEVPKRKTLFATGGGGEGKPKPKGFTVEEIKWMRENRPSEYAKLSKAHKLKIEL